MSKGRKELVAPPVPWAWLAEVFQSEEEAVVRERILNVVQKAAHPPLSLVLTLDGQSLLIQATRDTPYAAMISILQVAIQQVTMREREAWAAKVPVATTEPAQPE